MVPQTIESYLQERKIPFQISSHKPRATAQGTAAATHVSGKRFAKTVVLKRDGKYLLTVVPAAETVDLGRLQDALGSPVELASEQELEGLFPGCELGAMPPLGGLFGLPVIADACLAAQETIVMNGGTHTDLIELRWVDFVEAENPRLIKH